MGCSGHPTGSTVHQAD